MFMHVFLNYWSVNLNRVGVSIKVGLVIEPSANTVVKHLQLAAVSTPGRLPAAVSKH